MEVVKYCENCGRPLTEKDIEKGETLCRDCRNREYYFNDYLE